MNSVNIDTLLDQIDEWSYLQEGCTLPSIHVCYVQMVLRDALKASGGSLTIVESHSSSSTEKRLNDPVEATTDIQGDDR